MQRMNLLLSFALFLFTACQASNQSNPSPSSPSIVTGEAVSSSSSGMGRLRVLATDAPFDFNTVASAKITVASISLRSANGGRVTVMENPVTLELLDLKNGLVSTLADLEVPQGLYDQALLLIASASIDLKDGRHFPMTVPSGAQSGLKVFINPGINVGPTGVSDLLLDFDLSRSFVPIAGGKNITGFNFKPVIRAVNQTVSGALYGKVFDNHQTPSDPSDDTPINGAVVTIVKDGAIVGTAVSEANGYYKIIGLGAGSYVGGAVADQFDASEDQAFSISVGQDTEVNFRLMPLGDQELPNNL
jgi:hypothetical protein